MKPFTIFCCVAVLILVALAARGDTLDTATLVVDKTFFGANKHEINEARSIVTNIDPAACDAALPEVNATIKAAELADAQRVNKSNWIAQSSAICIHASYTIPDGTLTRGDACQVIYDPTKTIDENLAQCLQP